MCEPKFFTPGIARRSLLATSVIRRIASRDVPGFSTQCIRKSFSWKLGMNSSPSLETATPVAARAPCRSS